MLRNITVYLLLTLSMVTILADENMPLLEFVKDGEVIEARAMTQDEYTAYLNLKAIEGKLNLLEDPLGEFQEQLEIETQIVEEEVKAIEAKLKDMRFESLADLSQLAVLGDLDMTKVQQMIDQMQPMLDEVTAMSKEIGTTTADFTNLIMKDYKDSEIDQVKVIDGKDSKITLESSKLFINL